MKRIIVYSLATILFASCQTKNVTEAERFDASVIIQHSDLGRIKQFLPQLEEAARRGDLAPAYLAATKDRIDIREGRPQKCGTQFNCLLLDSLRVNEWRQEVGLPPMEIKK